MQRNTVAYSAAIRACEKGEQWQQTLELFARMPGEGVRRYTITCSAAINACEKGGEWQQTLDVSKGVVIGEENMRRPAYTNAENDHCMSSDTRSMVVVRPVVVLDVYSMSC